MVRSCQVVIDAGAAIRLKRLERFGGELLTTSGVYAEAQSGKLLGKTKKRVLIVSLGRPFRTEPFMEQIEAKEPSVPYT